MVDEGVDGRVDAGLGAEAHDGAALGFELGGAALAAALGSSAHADDAARSKAEPPQAGPTEFQIACMTLPYSAFPLERALSGIKSAGYRYVAWGVSHREEGKQVPVMAQDAVAKAPDTASGDEARRKIYEENAAQAASSTASAGEGPPKS